MEQVPAIFGDVAALALGACVGSFAVTVAYRLPRDISIATPRSFCESCERPVPWWANIPIFAYLASRGRCLMCGAPISARHLGGELALALAALYLYANFPLGDAIARFVFITALFISSLVDYDWRLIPNLITFPGVPVGFVLAAMFMPEVGWKNSLIGITLGGGVLFLTGFLYQMVRGQEGVGLGDVFLLAMVGAFIGWQGVLFTLFFGALLGSVGGLAVGLFGTPRDAPELPPSMREAAGAPAPARLQRRRSASRRGSGSRANRRGGGALNRSASARQRGGGKRGAHAARDRSSIRTIPIGGRRLLHALSTAAHKLVSIPLMAAGIFITLEGVEGSGKTTQAAILADELRRRGRRVTLTHEPGGTRAGEAIRAIFLDPAVSLGVASELLLVLADRAQHVREKLRPALEAGEIVISDRYSDSTTAYQGHGRGFDLKLVDELNRLASDGIRPALTIVLDCPVEIGLVRTRARARGDVRGYDRFEGEQVDFHRRVREGFMTIARAEPDRVTVIDSTRELAVVSTDILIAVERLVGH